MHCLLSCVRLFVQYDQQAVHHKQDCQACACSAQVKAGTWEGGHNKKATQYFNVIGYLVNRWVGYFVMLITIVSLCSTGIAQVVAISTGLYYLDIHISKR